MSPQKNDDEKGSYGEPEEPDNEKAKREFYEKLLTITDPRTFKKELSEFVFSIGSHPSISGTGIGLLPDGRECVRIYIADHKVDEVRDVLSGFVDIGKIPDPLPDKFRMQLTDSIVVELVRAPQAMLASGTETTCPGATEIKIPGACVTVNINIAPGHSGQETSAKCVEEPPKDGKSDIQEVKDPTCKCNEPPIRGASWGGAPRSRSCPPPPPAAGTSPSSGASQRYCDPSSFFSPLPAGVSVWRTGSEDKGTIGYFCKDNRDNTYMLSCNHVLADHAQGLALPASTGISRNGRDLTIMPIASLAEFVPLTPDVLAAAAFVAPPVPPTPNRVDAALAKITVPVSSRIHHGVAIDGTALPFPGLQVEKHGKASCITQGIIDDISCDMRVLGSDRQYYYFVEQIRVVSSDSRSFARRGDSGSLVFKKRATETALTSQAVGLLFAIGSRFNILMNLDVTAARNVDFALMNPIDSVMTNLQDRLRERNANDDLVLDFVKP